jgi:hypothetical protein
MKKLWNSIWFNILLDICFIAAGIFLFSNVQTKPESKTNLWIVLICLVLHAIYLIIIALINLFKKNFLKGGLFFLQLAGLAYVIFYGSLALVFSDMPMGVYTDEGSVNSAMQECSYSNRINDSLFNIMFTELKNNKGDLSGVSRKAVQDYAEEKPELTDTFTIARRGCRTYEDSVIVFRLLYSNEKIYDVEIRPSGKDRFVITGFRYSLFME